MSEIISISGIDGCGKTTIIEALRNVLHENGKNSKYVWLRYNHYLTKVLLAYCRLVKLTKYEYVNGIRVGYHEFYRSRFISCLFIFLTYIDTLLASVVNVYIPALISKKIIICDRWIFDIMVDLEVDTGISFPQGSFLNKAFMKIVPAGSHCFLVNRNKHSLLESRNEHSVDRNFANRLKLYEKLSQDPTLEVIDNNGAINKAVERIVTALNLPLVKESLYP